MKIKSKRLENLEKISVIFAAILGVIIFIWQVYASSLERREQIEAHLFCASERNQENILLSLEIVNVGQNPLFIKKAFLDFPISKTDYSVIIITFEENYSQTDGIQPGAGKEFVQQISIKEFSEWWSGGGKLFLKIESPTRSLLEVEITEYLKKFEAEYERMIPYDSLQGVEHFPCSP